MADVVVCDAVLGNVVIKFFEGLSTFIFDLWRAEFRAAPGPARVPADAPGHRPDPRRLRLREGRRLAAARRQKGTVIITHGRAKRRMIGYACEVAATTARHRRPGADRGGARRGRRADAREPAGARCATSPAEAVS